jgi:hypothetical protein
MKLVPIQIEIERLYKFFKYQGRRNKMYLLGKNNVGIIKGIVPISRSTLGCRWMPYLHANLISAAVQKLYERKLEPVAFLNVGRQEITFDNHYGMAVFANSPIPFIFLDTMSEPHHIFTVYAKRPRSRYVSKYPVQIINRKAVEVDKLVHLHTL